jgi:hypothetical protein
MGTHHEGKNTQPALCRDCEQQLSVGEGIVYSVWDYDWDDPDTDAQGSITVEMERYTLCENATECAERIVERGTNIAALRKIVQDRENYDAELRTRAREILVEYSRTAQELARGADMAAREAGYGAIGGYHG